MITHELLKRPVTKNEAVSLAEHLKDKAETTFETKPGYFYLDQNDTVYVGVDGRYGPTTLWRLIPNDPTFADQAFWERKGRVFRPMLYGYPKTQLHTGSTE